MNSSQKFFANFDGAAGSAPAGRRARYCLAVSPDRKFPVGRTTDLKSVGTLVAHLISPHKISAEWLYLLIINNRLSASHGSGWASIHTKDIREIGAD
jgi:hypothetical protein